MATTAAFLGVFIVLVGLALSAYAIYAANGRGASRLRRL